MIIESITIGFIVTVLGLISLIFVTGVPMAQAFRNTQMMGVFFVTGVMLALLSYVVMMDTTCSKCNSQECHCGNQSLRTCP